MVLLELLLAVAGLQKTRREQDQGPARLVDRVEDVLVDGATRDPIPFVDAAAERPAKAAARIFKNLDDFFWKIRKNTQHWSF